MRKNYERFKLCFIEHLHFEGYIIICSTFLTHLVQRVLPIYKLKLEHLVYALSRRICMHVCTWKWFQVGRGWFYSITSTTGVRARLFSRALLLDQSRNLGRRVKFIHGSDNRVKVCFTYRGEVFFGPSRFFFLRLFFDFGW